MNETLVRNWNGIVGGKDIVYFLGDLTFRSYKTGYWLRRLNGSIFIIKGNHDRAVRNGSFMKIITYKGTKFLLIHDPKDVPIYWNGWVIHGHKHNNSPGAYPLINKNKKTINVSCELLDYRPIALDKIYKMISSER